MTEAWKKIKLYPLYSVSSLGRVRNDSTGLIRRAHISWDGYYRIALYPSRTPGKKRPDYIGVARLVAGEFVDNPNKFPQVNHLDGIKTNNRPENLEWVTGSMNIIHALNTGLQTKRCGEQIYCSKFKAEDIIKIRQMWKSGKFRQSRIASKYGTSQAYISDIVRNKTWKHI